MTDGSALLMTMMYPSRRWASGASSAGSNLLDGGAHFYDTYRCADGKYVSIGPIEPQFYAEFLQKAGITDPDFCPPVGPRPLARAQGPPSPPTWPPLPAGRMVRTLCG